MKVYNDREFVMRVGFAGYHSLAELHWESLFGQWMLKRVSDTSCEKELCFCSKVGSWASERENYFPSQGACQVRSG